MPKLRLYIYPVYHHMLYAVSGFGEGGQGGGGGGGAGGGGGGSCLASWVSAKSFIQLTWKYFIFMPLFISNLQVISVKHI